MKRDNKGRLKKPSASITSSSRKRSPEKEKSPGALRGFSVKAFRLAVQPMALVFRERTAIRVEQPLPNTFSMASI